MTYRLVKLAPGAYDIFRGEEVIASLVRQGEHSRRWTAELLAELPPAQRPAPFRTASQDFDSLEQACTWLGAEVEGVGVRVPTSRSG